MCKKQTSVSHSSTESEIISVDAGLRLGGIPTLDFWDLIVAVLGNTKQNRVRQGDLLKNKREICSPPLTIHKRKQSQRVINELDNVAVMKMIDYKGKPDNEACFQNPQSCSWLVIRSN